MAPRQIDQSNEKNRQNYTDIGAVPVGHRLRCSCECRKIARRMPGRLGRFVASVAHIVEGRPNVRDCWLNRWLARVLDRLFPGGKPMLRPTRGSDRQLFL